MEKLAMLLDYHWCSGCHSCEVACQMEHDYQPDQGGIVVTQIGPWKISEDVWQFDNVVHITRQCDMCAQRKLKGKKSACEQACQACCLKVGPVNELAQEAAQGTEKILIVGR